MVRRLFDVCVSALALIVLAPLLLAAAVGVRISSPGPALYRARRVGRNGQVFTMLKFRTMHCRSVAGSSITAADDPRVFKVGRLLRAFKIDELPQLINVLRGEMAIVGPRPEAPDIVDRYYTPEYRESLNVRPGLTSPGSTFYYTHGETLLTDGGAEEFYVARLLPIKMQIDLNYLKRATFVSDFAVIVRTAAILFQKALGRRQFPEPPELSAVPRTASTAESGHKSAA